MTDWCRCKDLGPCENWRCPKCGKERRYHEELRIARSACVGVCGECRYEAEQKGVKPEPRLVRFVTSTTVLAGEHRRTDTYLMCDPCIDVEIVRQCDADVSDHRELPPVCPHCGRDTSGRKHLPQGGYCVLAPIEEGEHV